MTARQPQRLRHAGGVAAQRPRQRLEQASGVLQVGGRLCQQPIQMETAAAVDDDRRRRLAAVQALERRAVAAVDVSEECRQGDDHVLAAALVAGQSGPPQTDRKEGTPALLVGCQQRRQRRSEQVAQEHGVIYLNTNSSSPTESGQDCHRTKFVWDGHSANFSVATVRGAVEAFGPNWLLLTNDYVWGHETSAATRSLAEAAGANIVNELLVPQGTRDFSSYLLSIQQEDDLNVVAAASARRWRGD